MSESKLNDAGVQYLWSKIKAMFALKTDVPSPATATPGMDSVSGQVGASLKYAKEDHTHPKDSSKANVASPTFTGVPSVPTPATGTSSTQIANTAFVANSIAANNSVELPKKQNVLDAGRNITLTELNTGHVRIDGVDLTPLWNVLNDKVDDILVNGDSIVSTLTSGEKIASLTLQAGTNISIIKTGNTYRINNTASGGTVNLYHGITEPDVSLGDNDDIYLRLSTALGNRVDVPPTLASGGAYRGFTDTVDTTNKVYNFEVEFYDSWEYHGFLTFRYDNLTVGKTYRISFNYKTDETPVLYGVGELYGATIQYTSSCIDGRNVSGMVSGGEFKRFTDTYYGNFEYQSFIEDNQLHTYTFDFVAESSTVFFGVYGDRINMNALQVNCTGIVLGEVEEGNEIEDVYYKLEGSWIKDERGIYEDFIGATSQADGTHGLVPAPTTSDVGKVLGADGTWVEQTGGSEVEANPSGTATGTLTKLGIDGNIYEIQGGGGSTYFGVFVDVNNVIQPFINVTDTQIHSYTAIKDCAVTYYIPNDTNTDVFIKLDGVIVGGQYGQYINATSGIVYMKKGQVFTYQSTYSASSGAGYTVYGLQSGSEANYFQPIIYSTEEREIGVWVDNKPLYQKTIVFGSITNRSSISIGVANVEHISVVPDGSWVNDGERPLPYVIGSDASNNIGGYFTIGTSDTSFDVRMGNGSASDSRNGALTVQYTKTTDVAGSGKYNTLGVPNVHYDNSERVIGTWFGETLYQRTFDLSNTIVTDNTWNNNILGTNGSGISIKKYEGYFNLSGENTNYPYNFYRSSTLYNTVCTNTDSDDINIRPNINLGQTIYAGIVTIQYTKTS